MKRLWMAVALVAGILVASLVPGPFGRVNRAAKGGAGFLQSAKLPPGAVATLQRACGDCHSYNTDWPWYSRVAPASWLLQKDVSEGREFLNFSEWPEYGTQGQGQLLALAASELKRGSMPPSRYLALHTKARLSDGERSNLIAVLDQESARLLKTGQPNQ